VERDCILLLKTTDPSRVWNQQPIPP